MCSPLGSKIDFQSMAIYDSCFYLDYDIGHSIQNQISWYFQLFPMCLLRLLDDLILTIIDSISTHWVGAIINSFSNFRAKINTNSGIIETVKVTAYTACTKIYCIVPWIFFRAVTITISKIVAFSQIIISRFDTSQMIVIH